MAMITKGIDQKRKKKLKTNSNELKIIIFSHITTWNISKHFLISILIRSKKKDIMTGTFASNSNNLYVSQKNFFMRSSAEKFIGWIRYPHGMRPNGFVFKHRPIYGSKTSLLVLQCIEPIAKEAFIHQQQVWHHHLHHYHGDTVSQASVVFLFYVAEQTIVRWTIVRRIAGG